MKRFFELLFRGRFFLILQIVVSKTIPARWLRLGKSVYFRLEREKRQNVAQDQALKIRCGTETDVADIVRDLFGDDESVRLFFEDFYRRGIEPWFAERNEKVVGVVWLYRGHYVAPWQGYDAYVLRLEVEPTARFIANVFVAPECRGQGIFPKIAERFLVEYSSEEFYTCIDEDNSSSIRAHEKIGFRRCGATYYLQLFGRTRAVFVPRRGRTRTFLMPRSETVSAVLSYWEDK